MRFGKSAIALLCFVSTSTSSLNVLAARSSSDENLKEGRKLEDESTDKRLQEYIDAIFSTRPRVPVDDPLVGIGFSTPTYLEAMYKVSNNTECPAFQNDFQYIVESYQMLIQGYDKFFHSRAFDNGAVFAPGQVRI